MAYKVGGAYLSSEVQLGQRLAFKLMLVKQYGHSLVVTAGAGEGLEVVALGVELLFGNGAGAVSESAGMTSVTPTWSTALSARSFARSICGYLEPLP